MSKGIIILALMFTSVSFSQVGIGNTNPKSTLDISASNASTPSNTDGLLIPRISAFPAIDPTVDQDGMLAYLTTTVGSNAPGFYYWNNTLGVWENISNAVSITNPNIIEDEDTDTKIQVEESPDEDMIRFDLGGTEYFRMENGRLEVENTGGSVIIGRDSGVSDDFSGNSNVIIGESAAQMLSTGNKNVVIGKDTAKNLAGGSENVFIGSNAGLNATTVDRNIGIGENVLENVTSRLNIALGAFTLRNLTSGERNIGLGTQTLGLMETGNRNIVIGRQALYRNIAGNNNVAIGENSGFNNTGSSSVFIGYQTGVFETESFRLYIDNSNTTTPLIYGEFDNDLLRINGTLDINNAYQFPIADGTVGQVLATDGAGAIAWSTPDADNAIEDADGDTTIQVEESADEDLIRFDIAGTEYFRMEAGRVQVSNTNNNVFFGNDAGDLTATGGRNTAFGTDPLNDLTTGGQNVALGDRPLHKLTTGSNNIGIGSRTMNSKISGVHNIALGRDALYRNTTGSNNNILGAGALMDNATGSNNVAIGLFAGRRNLGSSSIFLGNNAGALDTESFRLYIDNSNTASPLIYGEFDTNLLRVNGTLDVNNAYQFPTTDGTVGQVMSSDGAGSITWSTPAANNIIQDTDGDTKIQVEESADEDMIRFDLAGTEYFRMENGRLEIENTGGSVILGRGAGVNDDFSNNSNVIIGEQSGIGLTTGSQNVAIGKNALQASTAGADNVAIGSNAARYQTSGEDNVFIGASSGADAVNANNNVALGIGTLKKVTSDENVALGAYALQNLTTGTKNIGIGALNQTKLDTGIQNVSIGYQSQFLSTSGSFNITMGNHSLGENISGSKNIAIGSNAGRKNIGSGSVFLGYNSGGTETGSNKLYIANTATSSPLIYGEFDNNLLRVNGTLDINNAYQFPTVDGTLGQVLSTDGAGNVVWSTDASGTDDQNISGSGLSGTNLTIGIEGGTSEVINLATLQDGTGTDDQNITGSGLSGTNLTIGIEGGTSETIDLVALNTSPLQVTSNLVRPSALVNINTDDFVFGATQLADNGNTNYDKRMFFDKSKGAFRTGEVNDTQWDDVNVGTQSFATGYNTIASGPYSIAFGYGNTASGYQSTAFGYQSTSTYYQTTAFGFECNATDRRATAFGYRTTASGVGATSWGDNTTASGDISTSWGSYTVAPSSYETVLGRYNTNYTQNTTIGWDTSDRLFVVGNGIDDTNRSNALTLLKNGDLGLGIDVPTAKLDIRPGDNSKGLYINHDKTTTGNTYGIQLDLDNTAGTNSTVYGAYIDVLKSGATNNTVYGVYGRGRDFQTGTGTRTTYGVRGYSYVSSTNGTTNSRGVYGSTSNNGDNEFGGYFVGDVYSTGTYQTSDRKLKNNIKAYSGALEKLKQLEIKSYDFKTKEFQYLNLPEGEQIGVVAQDLQKVFPVMVKRADETAQLVPREDAIDAKWSYREIGDKEMVEVGKDVEILAVNYTNLVPVLIQATKEQQEIIEQQKVTIDKQENQMKILEARLEKIEQFLLNKK